MKPRVYNRETRQLKLLVARQIAATLKKRKLTQASAAVLADDAASQMSLVCSGKVDGFSLERLLFMLAALNVTIRIVPKRGRKKGRVRLVPLRS